MDFVTEFIGQHFIGQLSTTSTERIGIPISTIVGALAILVWSFTARNSSLNMIAKWVGIALLAWWVVSRVVPGIGIGPQIWFDL